MKLLQLQTKKLEKPKLPLKVKRECKSDSSSTMRGSDSKDNPQCYSKQEIAEAIADNVRNRSIRRA